METNKLKALLKSGGTASGPIVEEVRTVGGVRAFLNAGHDFLWFDTEHNMFEWDTLLTMCQFTLACGSTPIVRVTDLSYSAVARALDTGAQGVVIPRVDNREQAEEAVSYAKYPPLGRRGAGGSARNSYMAKSAAESVEEGNRETMVIIQIESPIGVENLDEICSVPGVDVICVGPQDLSINLGMAGEFSNPVFVETIGKIAQTAEKHGLACGMVSRDPASFELWHKLGCRFLVCGSDLALIQSGATADVATLRKVTAKK